MTDYVVIAPMGANFSGGRLKLTPEQASSREHALKHVKGDLYEIVQTVQFKNGERIGYDGEVSKSMLEEIGEVVKTETEDINTMSKKELIAALEELEVEIPKKANKNALIDLLLEAREERKPGE